MVGGNPFRTTKLPWLKLQYGCWGPRPKRSPTATTTPPPPPANKTKKHKTNNQQTKTRPRKTKKTTIQAFCQKKERPLKREHADGKKGSRCPMEFRKTARVDPHPGIGRPEARQTRRLGPRFGGKQGTSSLWYLVLPHLRNPKTSRKRLVGCTTKMVPWAKQELSAKKGETEGTWDLHLVRSRRGPVRVPGFRVRTEARAAKVAGRRNREPSKALKIRFGPSCPIPCHEEQLDLGPPVEFLDP